MLLPLDHCYSLGEMAALWILSVASGLMTVVTKPSTLVSGTKATGTAIQLGWRAGFRAVLTGGALLVFLAVYHTLNATTAAAELPLKSRVWLTWCVAVAALLPGVFGGLLGGLLGRKLVSGRIPAVAPESPVSAPAAWMRPLSYGLLGLGLAGLASPLILFFRSPKAASPVAASHAPPPFHYTAPKALKTARLGQIRPAFTKTIAGVVDDAAMNLSPDGRLLVFCAGDPPSAAVTVFDLDRFQVLVRFPLPALPRSNVCWSPDLKRLACVVSSRPNDARLWVLDLTSRRAVELPRPANRDTPGGNLSWWAEKEIAFFPSDEEPLALNLDKLTLQPAKDSAFLLKLEADARQRWLEGPMAIIPYSAEWRFDLVTALGSSQPPPRREPGADWELRGGTFCALAHPGRPVSHGFRELPVKEGMRLFCTTDASKIIRVEQGQAQVSYMEVVPAPDCQFEVVMPMPFDEIQDSTLKRMVADHELCAFIHAPLVNPLNDKTVGPDQGRLKALVRLMEWKDHRAVFAVVTLVEPVEASDVISALHAWRAGRMAPHPVSEADWWASVKVLPNSSFAAMPDEVVLPALESPRLFELAADATELRVVKAKPRAVAPASPAPAAPLFPVPPSFSSPTLPPPAPQLDDAAVRAFVLEHHRKASDGDVDGLVRDYHSEVDFLNKGRLTQDAIRAEELKERARWRNSKEAVAGDIRVERSGAGWTAFYTLAFVSFGQSGEPHPGVADLTLDLIATPGGLRIVSQKAHARELPAGGKN